jgi:small subunit ribosomal protein S19
MAEELTKKSKDKFYRGVNTLELKNLSLREFAKFVKANPRRAILRNAHVIEKFIQKCEKRNAQNKPIKTHDRTLVVVPKMIGKTIHVYNGKEFLKVEIADEMLGHRLGEFALTRKIAKHTSLKKK